ncbi:glycosyltransferase family 2 protein [Empedobacter brevis]|uniref:glycosyltransferase family 2 protein n=1 Tax=Empedobacter brevis TaxID=247 RepID=UPI002896E1E9|nr:glycosyltransferase family 2 protein [Empedobacter brevis]
MFSISVIIPCYNSSLTIVESLNSIFYQKHIVNEIIIIDDGSTDNTISIIEQYIKESTFENFKLIKQKNSGPSVARNNGIKNSTSDWIAFLDSDDIWTPSRLEKQLKFLTSNPEVVLIGGGHEKFFFNKNIISQEISLQKLCFKNFFETPTVLVRKDICSTYYFDENMRYSEDYDLWLKIASKHKTLYINSILSRSVLKKRSFGELGLSKNIVSMEKGELKAITNQRKNRNISLPFYLFAVSISILKFLRRFIITKLR